MGNSARSLETRRNLTVLPVPDYGHCRFAPRHVLGALTLLLPQTGIPVPKLHTRLESLPAPAMSAGLRTYLEYLPAAEPKEV